MINTKPELQYGTLEDVSEGDRFRFNEENYWFTVYSTRGCMCGADTCFPEQEVSYYTGEWPGHMDTHGCGPSECESVVWQSDEDPPEVEWIANERLPDEVKCAIVQRRVAAWLKEKAEGKSADSSSSPSLQEGQDA